MSELVEYEVLGVPRHYPRLSEKVLARSPHEAVKIFRERRGDLRPTEVLQEDDEASWEVYGRCEACAATILSDDPHLDGTDGEVFCQTCAGQMGVL